MAFCPNCGAPVEGRFCPACGANIGGAPPQAGGTAPAGGGGPAASAGASGLTENMASALCYSLTLITGIVFLVLPPYNTNPRVRFHAFQAIFFALGLFVLFFGLGMFMIFLPGILRIMLGLVEMAASFGVFLLWLFLMWKAYNGEKLVLPIIGPLAEQQAGR